MRLFITTTTLLFTCLISAQSNNPFLKGMAEISDKNFDNAIELFSTALANNYKPKECYKNRGIAYYYNNMLSQAESDFKLAVELNELESLVWLAKIYSSNNNPSLCINYLKKYFHLSARYNTRVILKDKAFQTIHYSKEWQEFVLIDWESKIEKAINEAKYYLHKKLPNKGILVINNAIIEFGDNPELLFYRAILNMNSNNIPLALSDCYRAVKQESENIFYLELLADLYSKNNEYEKAINNYKKALEIKPQNFVIYQRLAKAQLANNSAVNAKKTLETYLQYFNSDTSAIFLSAKIYFDMGEYQNSLRNLNTLIENNIPQAYWYLTRGLCYEKTGVFKYAAADLSMCLDLEPFNKTANYHLGTVQYKIGNSNLACYYWKRALKAGELQATEDILENCP